MTRLETTMAAVISFRCKPTITPLRTVNGNPMASEPPTHSSATRASDCMCPGMAGKNRMSSADSANVARIPTNDDPSSTDAIENNAITLLEISTYLRVGYEPTHCCLKSGKSIGQYSLRSGAATPKRYRHCGRGSADQKRRKDDGQHRTCRTDC